MRSATLLPPAHRGSHLFGAALMKLPTVSMKHTSLLDDDVALSPIRQFTSPPLDKNTMDLV
jgi:hypothetical protein